MLTSRFSSSLGVYVLRFSCFLRRPNFMVLSALYLNISRRGIEMLDEKLFSVIHKFKHNPLLLSTSIKTFLFEVMQWIAKTIPSNMFFNAVVVYAFHIDPPFKAFDSNVVSNVTNLPRTLLYCDFCNVLILMGS